MQYVRPAAGLLLQLLIMDSIIRAFLGVFLMLSITVLGVGILTASLSTRAAGTYMESCVTEIENSNFAPEVIAACEMEAARRGYKLSVYPKAQNGSAHTTYAALELSYEFSIPVIGLNRRQTLFADAR